MRDAKPLAGVPDAAAKARAKSAGAMLASIEARRIVFVDGVFAPELSDLAALEPGLTIRSMAQALAANDPLVARHLGKVVPTDNVAVALNTAFIDDGAVIQVAAGAALARPIHLVFVNAGERAASVFVRSLVVVERGARAMLVESHEGLGAGADYQVNAALELVVGDEAHVDHVKVTGAGAGALHVSSLMTAIGAHARFNEFLFTTGGSVVRNQLFVRFDGEGAIAGIRGASLLNGREHADMTIVADHVAPACTSREMFKTVLDGEARGVFQGKIIVRAEAQKTDAKMATHALLLSDTRRSRQQAGAGDLRRRRAVRPRCDLGRSRRGSAVLPQGARHSGEGGRGAVDPGLRRRGGRGHRARRAARRADGSRRRLAEGARLACILP